MEGEQMVLTQRLEGDVPCQNELVVALVVRERREVERTRRQQLGEGVGDPAGGVDQVLVGGIVAEGDEQVGDGALGGGQVDGRLGLDGDEPWLGGAGALPAYGRHWN